jgi:hypothetical protein
MFKVFFDGIEVRGVAGFDEFTESIELEKDIRGLLLSFEQELTFFDDAYIYLNSKYNSGGYCQTINVLIQERCNETGEYEDDIIGLIFLSDVKWNRSECFAKCRIIDNGYGAKIRNNKNVKAKLNSPFSKTGASITPCPYTEIEFFVPSTALPDAIRYCYDVKDAFEYLVAFMTDGTVGFRSDYLDSMTIESTGAIIQRLAIVTGLEVRLMGHADAPNVSFQELFDEVNKKRNIGFTIEDYNGSPILRIENAEYFKNQAVSFVADKIPELEESVDVESLYSSVELGSDAATYDPAKHSLAPIRFITFQSEDYPVQSVCNIDNPLDLVSDFIIDTNIIEEMVSTNTSDDSRDDEIVMVQYYIDDIAYATYGQYVLSSIPPAYYNEMLTNKEVAKRWQVQGSISKYLGDGNDGFLATRTSTTAFVTHFALTLDTVSPYPFEDDSVAPNNDPNNRYNNTLYRYTSPAGGIYSFEFGIIVEAFGTLTIALFKVIAERYSAGNVLLETLEPFNGELLGGINTYSGNFTFYLSSGEYVTLKTELRASDTTFRYRAGATFSCIATTNGGGIYEPKDPAAYFVNLSTFEYPLNRSEFKTIKQDMSKAWNIGMASDAVKTAWIRKITRKKIGGLTACEMVTNLNNS